MRREEMHLFAEAREAKAVLEGRVDDAAMFRAIAGVLAPPPGLADSPLTPRQREVVRLVALGYTNKDVAQAMRVSVKTVETHRQKAMESLRLRCTADITRYAIRAGLVQA